MNQYCPSLQALAALHVAMQHVPQQWNTYLEDRMIYSKTQFKECCKNYI
jgi:hypothetical protein